MKNIIEALQWRYAVKLFDPTKKVSDEDFHTILETGRLAPSVTGIEPWKFIVVTDPEVRARLRAVSYDQPKVTDASHLIVIAQRTDAQNLAPELVERTAKAQGKTVEELTGLKQMAEGSIAGKSSDPAVLDGWLAAQTYIPLGMMIETASLLGIDTGPMGGFDPEKVSEILGLPAKNLKATTMLALGYRSPDDKYATTPKTRRAFDDVVETV